ncbi:MAG: aminoacyl-tRNA hydrolase [Verrucomicrobiae bacterium]|nr:aminoacyl-tRNA hydrolase [Verrucomicrobiae bacterium]
MTTRVVLGLGNPGVKYASTRHNIGFLSVEALAAAAETAFEAHARIPALVASWRAGGIRWLAVKPVTFMNLSGQAAAALMNFWKVPLDALLVVADDVELKPGAMRLRPSGSDGGHHGLESVIEHLGTKLFARLRLGIGRPPPDASAPLADWLLRPFSSSELPWMRELVTRSVLAVETWARQGAPAAMNLFNAAPLAGGARRETMTHERPADKDTDLRRPLHPQQRRQGGERPGNDRETGKRHPESGG